jgi:hypothetical protein
MGFAVNRKVPDRMPPGMPDPEPPLRSVFCDYPHCTALVAVRDSRGLIFTRRHKRWQVYEPADDSMKAAGRLYVECHSCGHVTVIEVSKLFA